MPPPEPQTPKFELGKHNWASGSFCVICGLHRDLVTEQGEEIYIYRTNDFWGEAPTACAPRLVEPFPGFLTSKEVCEVLGVTSSKLIHLAHSRQIYPAAVSRNNAYYWREDQLKEFKEEEPKVDPVAEVQQGYQALDRNWSMLHESAMGAIRETLKMPDASVPEMVAEIRRLQMRVS